MTFPFKFEFPFPPSVNTYYRTSYRSKSVYLSPKGKAFKLAVQQLLLPHQRCFPFFPSERLSVKIILHAGSRRGYDIDGRLKALLDAMENSVYKNDEQIDLLQVGRGHIEKGAGRCLVMVTEIQEQMNL